MTAPGLYIGLDAGATKTCYVARSLPDGSETGGRGAAANLKRQGLDGTAGVLLGLVEQARAAHALPVRAVCAGVAGAGNPADADALAEAMRRALPETAVVVVHDAAIALEGAFEGESGMIVIAGTGSVVFARTAGGTLLRAGGWGYLIGDEGSGHALGRAALAALADAFDGGPPTHLAALAEARLALGTPEALHAYVYDEARPLQDAAPLVLEAAAAGDAIACRLVAQQSRALALQASWVAARAEALAPRIALLGGLTHAPYYRQALTGALAEVLPGWSVQPPAHPAEVGALRLALAAAPAKDRR